MNKLNFNTEFNQDHYRSTLKIYLLENSEDTTYDRQTYVSITIDIVVSIGLVDDECLEWAACSWCCSWVVMNYIPTEQKIIDY